MRLKVTGRWLLTGQGGQEMSDDEMTLSATLMCKGGVCVVLRRQISASFHCVLDVLVYCSGCVPLFHRDVVSRV